MTIEELRLRVSVVLQGLAVEEQRQGGGVLFRVKRVRRPIVIIDADGRCWWHSDYFRERILSVTAHDMIARRRAQRVPA